MADKMDFIVKIASCLLVFCVALIAEVLCAGSSFSSNNPSNNAWPRLGNQSTYQVDPNWPNSGQVTPWPELGQRRQNQNLPTQVQTGPSQNQNGPTWVQNGATRGQNGPTWGQNDPMRGQNGPTQAQSGPTWVQNGPIWYRATTQRNFQNVPPPGTRIAGSANGPKQQTDGTVQDDDLRNFSETLLQKDTNNAAKFVTINFQGKTTSRSDNDEAPLPLLAIQRDAYDIPTIAKLMVLHNNYILETNTNEHISPQERQEENDLLDALLSTSILQTTRNFLIDKGKIGRDPKEFRDILKEIWFNMYSRGGGRIGSSGFEHVFLAELKNGEVSGLHNWLYFNEEEAKKTANYLGYLKKIELGDKGAILKLHFKFHNVNKPVGSMFIGTSPELEIALYTTCFLLRADRVCPLRLAGNNFIIRTYTYTYRGKKLIGSAFPEI